MQRRTSINNIKSTRFFSTINSSMIGIVITMACLLVFSLFMTKFDAPESVVAIMSSLALCIGAYSGGYISSKRRRQNGLLTGIITGILIYCVILFVGLIFAKSSISFSFLAKLIMTLVCGAIGGIVGVNSRRKKY